MDSGARTFWHRHATGAAALLVRVIWIGVRALIVLGLYHVTRHFFWGIAGVAACAWASSSPRGRPVILNNGRSFRQVKKQSSVLDADGGLDAAVAIPPWAGATPRPRCVVCSWMADRGDGQVRRAAQAPTRSRVICRMHVGGFTNCRAWRCESGSFSQAQSTRCHTSRRWA